MDVTKEAQESRGSQESQAAARNPRRWVILVVLCLSALVLVIDNMVLTVSVPTIADSLRASAQDIQWIIDSYILVFAGMLLTAGSLADRFGRRRMLIIGLSLFGGASLLAAFAASPAELIAGRVLMGFGGALVMPSTLSILMTVFDAEELRKAFAIWGGASMIGLIGGPVVGGIVIAHFSWGAIFLMNVPVAAVAIVAAVVLMPESKGPSRKADPLGMVLSMVGMTALVWTIIEAAREGLTRPGILAGIAVTLVSLVAFGIWETRVESPMAPLSLFRNRVFSASSFSLVLVTFANGGLMLVLTQYLQFVLGYSAVRTGVAFAPLAVAALVFNSLGATLGAKIGNRTITVAGLLVIAAGFGALTTLSAHAGFGTVALGMMLIGAGAGLAMPAATTALMSAIPTEHAGVGSALNDTVQQAGAALGVAVLGTVLSSTFTGHMPASAPGAARHSVSAALSLAASTGDGKLAAAAREAFTSAMSASFVVGACGVLVAAALALVLMRNGRPEGDIDVEAEAEVGAPQPALDRAAA